MTPITEALILVWVLLMALDAQARLKRLNEINNSLADIAHKLSADCHDWAENYKEALEEYIEQSGRMNHVCNQMVLRIKSLETYDEERLQKFLFRKTKTQIGNGLVATISAKELIQFLNEVRG